MIYEYVLTTWSIRITAYSDIDNEFDITINDLANAPDGVNASPQICLFVMFNFFSNDRNFRNSINKPLGVCQDVYGSTSGHNDDVRMVFFLPLR